MTKEAQTAAHGIGPNFGHRFLPYNKLAVISNKTSKPPEIARVRSIRCKSSFMKLNIRSLKRLKKVLTLNEF